MAETNIRPNIKAIFFDVDGTLLSNDTYSVPNSPRQSGFVKSKVRLCIYWHSVMANKNPNLC